MIRHRSAKPTNWLAVAVAVVSLGTQAGFFFVSVGRVDAFISSSKETQDKHEKRLTEVERENAKQDTAIASDQVASKIAYEDIIRRLASIETKLDNRR